MHWFHTGRISGVEVITLVALVCLVTLLCGLPLFLLFKLGLAGGNDFAAASFAETLASRSVRRALWNSLESSLISAALATIVGLTLALAIGLTNIRFKGLFVFLLLLPMMIPPHVTAIAWIQALGPASPVLQALAIAPAAGAPHPIYSREGIIALLTLQHAPLVMLLVRAALRAFPRELSDAARACGASTFTLLARVIVPLLAPVLLAGFALAFIAALGNFGVNALLGIPARYTTLPVLIWRRLAGFGPDILPNVAILSIVLALVVACALIVQFIVQRQIRTALIGPPQLPLAIDLGRRRAALEAMVAFFIAATLVLPLVSLVATALVPTYGVPLSLTTLTFDNLSEILTRQAVTARAFLNSFLAAGTAAIVVSALSIGLGYFLIVARPAARRTAAIASAQAEIAYAVPGLVISIAFILAFIRPLPLIGLSIYGTLWIIFIAYIAAFLAIGLKPVSAAYAQLDPSLDDAARVAGAGFAQRLWRIYAPLIAPAAGSGAILVFLTAYNEVTVSALLWSTGSETIGTVIFNYEDGGYTTLAAAMSTLTVIATAAIMLALNAVGRYLPPGIIAWRD